MNKKRLPVLFIIIATLVIMPFYGFAGGLFDNPDIYPAITKMDTLSVNSATTVGNFSDTVSPTDSLHFGQQHGTDFMRMLSGQVPGLEVINTGGITGSGTNLIIRGYTSFTGTQDPLIIVDGVRFDGTSNHTSGAISGGGSLTTPNRFIDLDPNNIQSVSVLKSLAATSLYGEQGRNGVIVIETKTGTFNRENRDGFGVVFNQSIYATQISSRPDYQNDFGVGFNDHFLWTFGSWGPRFDTDDISLFGNQFRGYDQDGTILTALPPGIASVFPMNSDPVYRYEARPNPIEAFFRTGMASNSNLNISGGAGNLAVNVNYSRSEEDGFTPNNSLGRNAFSTGIQYSISPRLTARNTFNISLTDVSSPVLAASGLPSATGIRLNQSVFADVFNTPRSIGLDLPHEHPVTGGSVYYRMGNDIPHPLWVAENTETSNSVNRYFGKSELIFDATDRLSVRYRVGYDNYTENQQYSQFPGGIYPQNLWDGFLQTVSINRTEWEHNLYLTAGYEPVRDLSVSAIFGGQYISSKRERQGIESHNMIMQGLLMHSNFMTQRSVNHFTNQHLSNLTERQTAGIYGSATFGIRDILFLTASGRNDWDSTLRNHQSTFYPAVNLSYILSEHLGLDGGIISYMKLFGGVGTSGRAPEPYSTGRASFGVNTRSFVTDDGTVVTQNINNLTGNFNLKPEYHVEYQGGAGIDFFDGKIGMEAVYYTRTITNLIRPGIIDPSTGFTITHLNTGEIQNNGFELTLRAKPLTGRVSWDMMSSFYTSGSEVIEIGEDIDRLPLGIGLTSIGNFAIKGEPYTAIYGSRIMRVTEELRESDGRFSDVPVGTPLVGLNGQYMIDEPGVIGDANPDWTLSVSNIFRFKTASLSFRFDYQQGGDMYSTWIGSLLSRGMITETTRNNRRGIFYLPGVSHEDGSPNQTLINHEEFFFHIGSGIDEMRVYDMTHLRLSNITLSYELPAGWLAMAGIPFRSVTVSLSADNMWLHTVNLPDGTGFDPNVNSGGAGVNSRGLEFLTGPNARRFGGNINVRF